MAQTNYQRIHSFGPSNVFGSSPRGQLIEASDGFLYGTTYQGGSNLLGTVFRLRKDGSDFAAIHHFGSGIIFPVASVTEGADGALYGTVPTGGSKGGGVVYKLNKNGTGWNILHHFDRAPTDGDAPLAALLKGTDGLLYGTTAGGGTSNLGTIFRINADGSDYAVLHHFAGTNGSLPAAALVEGHDGWLYGTTRKGGSADLGTVFKVQKTGANHTVLREFLGQAQADGAEPLAGISQGADGLIYGTTQLGGSAADLGTVFKVSTNGTGYQVIHVGQNNATDGWQPISGLVQGPGGVLYGTFRRGGSTDNGVAFRMNTDGTGFSLLHSFTTLGGDGTQPFSPLLLGSDGALYGSTYFGGDYTTNNAHGIIFRLFASAPQVRITSIDPQPTTVALTFVGGAAGQVYSIQSSTNLLPDDWSTIGSATANIDGTFGFSDPAGAGGVGRFYRSRTP